jgi:hypothetical protein
VDDFSLINTTKGPSKKEKRKKGKEFGFLGFTVLGRRKITNFSPPGLEKKNAGSPPLRNLNLVCVVLTISKEFVLCHG